MIYGYIEPSDEYIGNRWKIQLQIRNDVFYDSKSKRTIIKEKESESIVKTLFTRNEKFNLGKHLNEEFINELQTRLVKDRLIVNPYSIWANVSKTEFVFSNIVYDNE